MLLDHVPKIAWIPNLESHQNRWQAVLGFHTAIKSLTFPSCTVWKLTQNIDFDRIQNLEFMLFFLISLQSILMRFQIWNSCYFWNVIQKHSSLSIPLCETDATALHWLGQFFAPKMVPVARARRALQPKSIWQCRLLVNVIVNPNSAFRHPYLESHMNDPKWHVSGQIKFSAGEIFSRHQNVFAHESSRKMFSRHVKMLWNEFRYKLKEFPDSKNFRATSKNVFTLCTNWTMPKAFKIAPNMAKTA